MEFNINDTKTWPKSIVEMVKMVETWPKSDVDEEKIIAELNSWEEHCKRSERIMKDAYFARFGRDE